MKTKLLLSLFFLLIVSTKTMAQGSLKAEYFGTSSYKDNNGNKVGNGKGYATVYRGDIKIPIIVERSKDSLTIAWLAGINGTHALLDNENLSQDLVVSNITNLQISLINVRPLNMKWSLITFAGVGIYTSETQLTKVNANSILGSGGAIFIKKINPQLDLGAGIALNNALGYPMLFPALYLKYSSEGRYTFNVSMTNGFQASAGYNLNETIRLNLVSEINGQLSLLRKEGRDVMFTHQYIVAGLRPEIKLSKHLALPITVGVNALRSAYFTERKLKSIFDDKSDSKFDFSPYLSAEINYRF